MRERLNLYQIICTQFALPSLREGLGVGSSSFLLIREGLGVGSLSFSFLLEGLGVGFSIHQSRVEQT